MRLLCKPHLSRNPAWPRKPTAPPPRKAPRTQDGPGFFAQLLPFVQRASNDSLQYPGDCQPFFCSFFPRVFRSPGAPSGTPLRQAPVRHRGKIIPAQKSKSRGKMRIFFEGCATWMWVWPGIPGFPAESDSGCIVRHTIIRRFPSVCRPPHNQTSILKTVTAADSLVFFDVSRPSKLENPHLCRAPSLGR
jgi:hypothetical protein